jgi:uncharacterized repeat protein (TIGR03806 family)
MPIPHPAADHGHFSRKAFWRLLVCTLAGWLFATTAFAQITRVANTTLTLPQNPETFGYRTEQAFAGITFTLPLGFATAPGETNRVFVVEKQGRIQAVTGLGSTPGKQLFFDLSSRVLIGTNSSSEEGLLGVAFHPNFATNRYFYVFYTVSTTTTAGTGRHDRLSRFTAASGATNADILATEVPMISQFDEAHNHNGGELHFGPDGYLYLSLGDEGGANDQYSNSQRIDRDFFAGMLRLDVDRLPGNLAPNTHPAVHAGTYSVPADNPFVGATTFNGAAVTPANVRTEFWAVGLRNPWRFSFDRPTGRLFVGDVGQAAREEINIITRGGNYGWSYREGTIAGPRSNPPAGVTFIDPIWEANRTLASSITGGVVYRGTRFSQLFGQYVFGDYPSGRVFAMSFPNSGPVQVQTLLTETLPVGFGADPSNGDILIASISTGAVRRLVYNSTPTGTALPATLTATGAFSDLTTLTPAAGIVPYTPNVSFWSDHARKNRWFSVPAVPDKITFAADGNWTFPAGTVWVKHFDLELTRGNPSTARRLETRFIVKTADGIYGVTYRWNAGQTEATLVPEEGADEVISINDGGTIRNQTWRYPSRSECLQCHTSVAGHALSFNTAQLNRSHTYGATTANQLTALASAGYFTTASIPAPTTLRALAASGDTGATLEHRARSYLAANCISCHQPGGASLGNWDARIQTPTASTGLINGTLTNNAGDAANRVVVPADTAHSMLLTRISTRGATQMPPLASHELDDDNIALISAWINAITTDPTITSQPTATSVSVGSSATFTVVAAGVPAPTYQWRKDGSPITGATSASYTINNAQLSHAGSYSVVVTNSASSVTSNSATLSVLTALPDPVVTTGHNLTLHAGQGGSYQWQVSTNGGATWTNLTDNATFGGTTTNTLTITNATSSLNGQRIRYIATNGTSTTSAAVTLTVNAALFPSPISILTDASGNLYVGDAQTCTVQQIASTGVVSLLAGSSGQPGSTDGAAAAARFNQPGGLALASGVLSVADTGNNTVRRITLSTATVTTLAGSSSNRGHRDDTGTAAWFSSPIGLALNPIGTLTLADSLNETIRQITTGGVVTTLVGSPGNPGTANGSGATARFRTPSGVVRDSSGNFFVTDTGNSTIRKITLPNTVTTFVGLEGVTGTDDGTGADALFNQPTGLAIDTANNLYVADTASSTIRKVSPAGVVTTLAGLPGVSGLKDGSGTEAWFSQPRSLTVDISNNVYVADTGNGAIRRITPAGVVTTLALTASSGGGTNPGGGGTTTPPASGGGGGGGALSLWSMAALALLCFARLRLK